MYYSSKKEILDSIVYGISLQSYDSVNKLCIAVGDFL